MIVPFYSCIAMALESAFFFVDLIRAIFHLIHFISYSFDHHFCILTATRQFLSL